MGVQVVQNQMDFPSLSIHLQRQKLHKAHKIWLGPPARAD